MQYILLGKIKIERPILFLCGPYYDRNDKSDRRVILQQKIYEKYSNKYLPLVIDDFLTKDNLKDDTISIQLMEEICAAVSYKTFIFLDTMSSATELGIFSNSAYINKLKVYIPKITDIYNKGNVGYFVRDVVMKSSDIECFEYRPAIARKAIATDYIVEHYKFVENKLPSNIEKDIENDSIFNMQDDHEIRLINKKTMPDKQSDICYLKEGKNLYFNVSVRMLFYITLSVISCEHKDLLDNREEDFSKFNINNILNLVKECILNYASIEIKESLLGCAMNLNTVLKVDELKLVKHIVKFIHTYYLYSKFHSIFLIPNPLGKIIQKVQVAKHLYTFLDTNIDTGLINDVLENPNKYYDHIEIKKNKKKREIVKYKNDINGEKIRELHKELLEKISNKYIWHENSFAYRKGINIKQCVEKHLNSNGFLKYDIKKFFNSINLDKLLKCFIEKFNIDSRFQKDLESILSTCFYEGKLPLGLILSPILSDIYLSDFDKKISSELNDKGFIYTRYADDIMISSPQFIEPYMSGEINQLVNAYMKKLGLVLNDKKQQYINFDEKHNFIRYVGLNIVKGINENYISLGKTYIYDAAKRYILYLQKVNMLEGKNEELNKKEQAKLAKDIFYEKLIIIGKIGFINQIEGRKGITKIRKRLFKYNINFSII